MDTLDAFYDKIKDSLHSNISDSTVIRVVEECDYRTQMLGMDFNELLNENTSISINHETGEIDIRQNVLFGIFWSFDSSTGDLVGT